MYSAYLIARVALLQFASIASRLFQLTCSQFASFVCIVYGTAAEWAEKQHRHRYTSVSLRCHSGFTLMLPRTHFDVTSISLRFHFDFVAIVLRCHFGLTSISLRFHFDVTSIPIRFRFDFASISHWFQFDCVSIPIRVRVHFDFTSMSLRIHFGFISFHQRLRFGCPFFLSLSDGVAMLDLNALGGINGHLDSHDESSFGI